MKANSRLVCWTIRSHGAKHSPLTGSASLRFNWGGSSALLWEQRFSQRIRGLGVRDFTPPPSRDLSLGVKAELCFLHFPGSGKIKIKSQLADRMDFRRERAVVELKPVTAWERSCCISKEGISFSLLNHVNEAYCHDGRDTSLPGLLMLLTWAGQQCRFSPASQCLRLLKGVLSRSDPRCLFSRERCFLFRQLRTAQLNTAWGRLRLAGPHRLRACAPPAAGLSSPSSRAGGSVLRRWDVCIEGMGSNSGSASRAVTPGAALLAWGIGALPSPRESRAPCSRSPCPCPGEAEAGSMLHAGRGLSSPRSASACCRPGLGEADFGGQTARAGSERRGAGERRAAAGDPGPRWPDRAHGHSWEASDVSAHALPPLAATLPRLSLPAPRHLPAPLSAPARATSDGGSPPSSGYSRSRGDRRAEPGRWSWERSLIGPRLDSPARSEVAKRDRSVVPGRHRSEPGNTVPCALLSPSHTWAQTALAPAASLQSPHPAARAQEFLPSASAETSRAA